MLLYLSKKQICIAITITLLVFLIYCGFIITIFGSLVELYDAIAFALRSGAIGFQLIGILYLLSQLNRVFKDDFPSTTCYQGDDSPYTAVKRILYNSKYFITFIAAFLSPFIIIYTINFLMGNISLLSLTSISPSSTLSRVLYDIFIYGVIFTNYVLLGAILWILISMVSAIGEIKNARYGIYDIVDIYCPDRVGGLSPVKKYLFSILYVFLMSITMLMIGHISLLPSFITHALGHGLFRPYSRAIAEFCVLSLFSILGVVLTVIGLNRLCSFCLKMIEERIMGINERYRVFQKKLFAISPDELDIPEEEINNLKSVVEIYSNEREKLLQWYSDCSGINVGTAIKIFVAYIPPLVAIAFQVFQLLRLV